ncbi:hypothetical protein ABW19_dt0201124 [Dactylella cylindrospora]|nr:hypothetical protein ABW19_dt0201124 [Dactylella cylindrospora]
MADREALEAALTLDWGRQLNDAPELIHILGICTALSSKTEIMTLQLEDRRLANQGLVSNLLHLSNHGQSAFQEAHSDTYKISVRAYDIGRNGGHIDKIVGSFGNPSAKRRVERSLRALDQQVKSSEQEGKKTKDAFDQWKDKTNILQEAVNSKLSQNQRDLINAQASERQINSSLNIIQQDTQVAQERAAYAQKVAAETRSRAERTFDRLTSKDHGKSLCTHTLALNTLNGKVAITMLTGWVGLAISSGVDTFHSYKAESSVRMAEMEYQRHSNALNNCRRHLAEVQNTLNAANTEREKWEKICETVAVVLNQLTSLQKHIKAMVDYFTRLSDNIKLLSEQYNNYFRSITEDELKGEASQEDLDDLKESSREVKVFALVVYSMAGVYSRVSQDYLFQGFQLISSLSNQSSRDIPSSELIQRSAGQMAMYHSNAKAGIARSVHEAKIKIFDEAKKFYPDITDDDKLNPRNQPPPYSSTSPETLFAAS